MRKGIVIINPYLVPQESIHQAERLKSEFANLNVQIEIVSNAFLNSILEDGKLKSQLNNIDFAIYLDKDKYQSEILSKMGIRLFNSHESIRLCDDKAVTYIALSGHGLNLPKTIFGSLCYSQNLPIDKEWAKEIAKKLKFPLIAKESFGSMGKGIYMIENENDLLSTMEKIKLKPHLFQEYLPEKKGTDVRVIVIGGKAVAAMERRNESDFRSNVAQGGNGYKIELTEEFKDCAQKCAKILGLDYCGVDLLYGNDNKPYVCEVNSNAFFSGIEKATNFNIAKYYAEHILKTL